MHPGVGAAGPVDRPADPIAESCQCGLEFALDCPETWSLDLEAGKVRAVVFDPCPVPNLGSGSGDALSGASWVAR
jgi:hypothetical protein